MGPSLWTHQIPGLRREAASPEASEIRLSVTAKADVGLQAGQVHPPGGRVVVVVVVVVVAASLVGGAVVTVVGAGDGGAGGAQAVARLAATAAAATSTARGEAEDGRTKAPWWSNDAGHQPLRAPDRPVKSH